MSVRILNANLLSITRIELLQSLKRGVLVTPNLDHLVKLQHDREFYDLYQKGRSGWFATVKSCICALVC